MFDYQSIYDRNPTHIDFRHTDHTHKRIHGIYESNLHEKSENEKFVDTNQHESAPNSEQTLSQLSSIRKTQTYIIVGMALSVYIFVMTFR